MVFESPNQVENERIEPAQLAFEKESLKINAYASMLKDRKRWSNCLMTVFIVLVISNIGIVIGVGRALLIFDPEFLKIAYITFALEIIGLIWIVVKFLFNEPPKLK